MPIDDPHGRQSLPEDDALVSQVLEGFGLGEVQADADPVATAIRKNIRFRLLGYSLDDTPVPWQEDVSQVMGLESDLVLDPLRLKKEFENIRMKRAEGLDEESLLAYIASHTKFGRLGAHVYANTADILFAVRRQGWVILAGLERKNGAFHPLGFNYGLHSMPEDDDEFRLLAKSTLGVDDSMKKDIAPHETAVNWRTGIAQFAPRDAVAELGVDVSGEPDEISIRRIGIASALKYIFTSLEDKMEKKEVMFNIGTIYDSFPGSRERIRNVPSYHHNIRYFEEDFGYRTLCNTQIKVKGPLGEREQVAFVRWRARGDKIQDTKRRLLGEESKLAEWDVQALEARSVRFYEQIQSEKKVG